MTELYGDTRQSVLRRPATPPGHCIVGHHHRHQLGTLSACPLVDRPPLCVRAGRAATSCKPSTAARWVDRKLSESLPKLSLTHCTYRKDIGANELHFILSTMLTLFDLYWPHGTFCAPGSGALWIAGMAENLILCYVWNVPRTRTILGSHRSQSGTHVGDLGSRSHASGAMDGSDMKPPGWVKG